MVNRISALHIKGFRGASQPFDLKLDANKPVILIFGENGTGKSTIVDALECVGTGNTSFTDDWKLGKGRRKEGFIPTLGKDLADVDIRMWVDGQPYMAQLNAKGVRINEDKRPVMKVLRRKSLQAFIDADPAQRYQVVSTFLDIPQIEMSENSLRTATKTAEDQFNAAVRASEQAQRYLYGLWEAEGKPGDDGQFSSDIHWAKQQAQTDTNQLTQQKQMLSKRVESVQAFLRASSATQQAGANLKAAQQQQQTAQAQLKQQETAAINGSAALDTLLRDAKIYLEATPSEETCPVCETTRIEPTQLIDRLDQRLDAMQQLGNANATLQQAQQRLSNTQDQYQSALRVFFDASQSVLNQVEALPPIFTDFAQKRIDDSAAALKLASQLVILQSAELPKLKSALEDIGKQLVQLNSISYSVKTLDGKTAEAKRGEQLYERLLQAVRLFEQERKAYVEAVLKEIASTVDALYQQIHPDEALGGLRLKLDENQRGSLLYGVAFGNKDDIQPQPYYSESHLDTLGLCIFLALAQRASKECIVVLDDVLGSVDQQHLHRTVDMLIAESADLGQIIVTTHYRPLRNRFTNSRTGSSQVKLIDLKPWSLHEGVKFSTPKLAINELEAKLALDCVPREQIAIDAGRLLENAFDYLTLLYGVRMARKPEPFYTLGELNSAVRSIKNWQIAYDGQTTEIKPLLDALQPLIPVRNEAGAHYNESGELLSDEDITAFGLAALTLLKALICRDCNSLAQKQDNVGHWKCQCGHTTMQPYKI